MKILIRISLILFFWYLATVFIHLCIYDFGIQLFIPFVDFRWFATVIYLFIFSWLSQYSYYLNKSRLKRVSIYAAALLSFSSILLVTQKESIVLAMITELSDETIKEKAVQCNPDWVADVYSKPQSGASDFAHSEWKWGLYHDLIYYCSVRSGKDV